MSELGYIEVTEHHNLGRLEHRSYKWIGPPKCWVDFDLLLRLGLDADRDTTIGQFRLKFIERKGILDNYSIYVRKDYPLWWLIYFMARFTKHADLFYRRLIWTLVIWKLADYQPGALASWRDINIIRKLRK